VNYMLLVFYLHSAPLWLRLRWGKVGEGHGLTYILLLLMVSMQYILILILLIPILRHLNQYLLQYSCSCSALHCIAAKTYSVFSFPRYRKGPVGGIIVSLLCTSPMVVR